MGGMGADENGSFDFSTVFAERTTRMDASVIREILKVAQRPDVISFAGGLPAPELFPVEEVRQAADLVLTRDGASALQYSTTEGYVPLREWIAARQGGIPVENVQIVTGSQQGLDLLGKILLSRGDVVLVESPTYLGALQSFNPYGPQYVQIPTDDHGIDVDALADQLEHQSAKLLYAVPNFQNPTGRTLSLDRRRRLVEVTAKHNVLVIEDDPYGELRFTGESLPSLYSLGLDLAEGDVDNNHVIHSGSFSKTLVPGLRDAWVQAAHPIIEKLIQAKQGSDLHTPTFNQMIIAELVHEVLPRQVELVKRVYGERALHMIDRITERFPAGIEHTTPEGGMFLWLTLPDGVDTEGMLIKAVKRGVAYVPGSPFFALGGGENTMRLSYSCATLDQIDVGIDALAQTIRDELGESPAA